ncbi:MAG: PIN domain-containing protein [Pseudonocardia sp.]
MTVRVVLDAGAFDVIDQPSAHKLWALIERSIARDGDLCCAAVTLAEVCRGTARTRRIEAALARTHGGARIMVIPTDERLAKLVGSILHESGTGSEMLGDAHVVAACTGADSAVVVTSDPGDIRTLAASVPGVRIATRTP